MNSINCCHVAIIISIIYCLVTITCFAMFFNYNLKLDARTAKLEKKNGEELRKIEKLEKDVQELKKGVRK